MEKDWDIEQCRTKFESEEHWNLKKEFILAHKNKFKKHRCICLAQAFVNVQLLRCKYPDPLMRQIAELSKGIGFDYKTKQKERLQRTFVKASDAASAKVKGLKPNYSKIELETNSGNDEKKESEDKTFITSKNKNKRSQSECSLIQDDTDEGPSKKMKICFTECSDESNTVNKYSVAIKNSNAALTSFVSPRVASVSNKLKMEKSSASNKVKIEAPSVSNKVKIEAPSVSNKVKIEAPSVSNKMQMEKFHNSGNKSFPEEYFDEKDLLTSNLFLVSRNYSKCRDYRMILGDCLNFSKLVLHEEYRKVRNKEICVLTTRVNGNVIQLGESEGLHRKFARENAAENALQNILHKCFTIQIKKKFDDDGKKITMDILNDEIMDSTKSKNDDALGSDNVGAKLLKMMGWSGGGLGKNEEGIKEPIRVSAPIGRQGLGLKDENAPIPAFKKKVKEILNEMKKKVLSSYDDVVKDTVFACDLSNEQRKYIHLLVRREYKQQLKSVSYGKRDDRCLVVKPNIDPRSLIFKVLSQGGSTDLYHIHKPGTLTMDDFLVQD